MTAGRRDFDGSPRGFHSLHVAHIRAASGIEDTACDRGRQDLGSFEVTNQGFQIGRGQDVDMACLGGLAALFERANKTEVPGCRGDRGGKHTGHLIERSIEG